MDAPETAHSDATAEPLSDDANGKANSPTKKLDGRAGQGARVKQYQWKKGTSGNPSGRPKGKVSVTEQVRRRLAMDPAEAKEIVDAWLARCKGENGTRDLALLLDRTEGLLVKKVEISDTSHMKRLGFKDPLETVPIDEADEPRTLDMSAGDGSDEDEQANDGDGSE